jgi:hypothetical protein
MTKRFEVFLLKRGKGVFVHCVLDGRRELRDILQQRLLR